MSYSDYKKKKEQVLDILKQIKENIGEEYIKERIEKRRGYISEDRFTIAVFGHFSNGKSTFLNALMGYGEEILKEDEVASTATITKLVYPEDISLLNKARIIYSNNEEEIINCDNIKEFTARNVEFNVEEEIKEVIVYFDSEFLKNGVEIVDTPGFNSTHKLHTDIAKSYIKDADASIFLFAADKPGAKNELQFLREINENINKIFFLLNKIDLCNFTEGQTIENACDKLKYKLISSGIDMKDKKIYPISALKKKEAIKENWEQKNKESMFDIFTIDLANYLTSDENIKDRLEAPIKHIMNDLIQYKNELNDKVNNYSSNKEDIESKINEEKILIKNLEKELSSKKKGIDREVKKVIKKSESAVKEELERLNDDIDKMLSKLQSKFSTSLYKFEDINENLIKQIIRVWNKEKLKLENDLIEVIDENIDDNEKIKEAEDKIMPIINDSLRIQNIKVGIPEFNFERVNEIDRKIEEAREKYEECRKALNEARKLKIEKEIKVESLSDMKNKIRSLEDEKRERLRTIGEGKIIEAKKTVQYEEDRSGVFGWIGNKLLGPKKREQIEEYKDYTYYNHAKKERVEIEKEYEKRVLDREKELESMKDKVCELGDIDYNIGKIEIDEKLIRDEYMKKSSIADEEKIKIEKEIISMTKSQYKDDIRDVIDNFEEKITIFLKESRKFLTRIITELLDDEVKKIEMHKEKVYDLLEVNDSNPIIIESNIKDLYINIDSCNKDINKLIEVKESL